ELCWQVDSDENFGSNARGERCDRHLEHGGLSDVARTPVAHMGLLEHEILKVGIYQFCIAKRFHVLRMQKQQGIRGCVKDTKSKSTAAILSIKKQKELSLVIGRRLLG
ncbi:hypothetical protein MUK42_37069, partial [Musa troglodytarum]